MLAIPLIFGLICQQLFLLSADQVFTRRVCSSFGRVGRPWDGFAFMGAYWMSIGRFQMPIWRRGVLIAPPKLCHGFLSCRYLLALP